MSLLDRPLAKVDVTNLKTYPVTVNGHIVVGVLDTRTKCLLVEVDSLARSRGYANFQQMIEQDDQILDYLNYQKERIGCWPIAVLDIPSQPKVLITS